MQSNHKNTFRTKFDSIYEEIIGKQQAITLYMGTPGVKSQILTTNDQKYWYYANNFPICTIW